MEFEIKSVWKNDMGEPTRIDTIELPDELPASVGEKAERKLNANIDMSPQANNSRDGSMKMNANVKVTSAQFFEVKAYIVKAMLNKYTEKSWNFDEISKESMNDIARYYYNQLRMVADKKK